MRRFLPHPDTLLTLGVILVSVSTPLAILAGSWIGGWTFIVGFGIVLGSWPYIGRD